MTPAQAIDMLDRQLAEHGQDVILRKTNTAVGQVTARAFVRGYRPEEVVGLIKQGDKKITLSPTGLAVFGVPQDGHFVVVDGRPRTVLGEPETVSADGVPVRVNLTVRG